MTKQKVLEFLGWIGSIIFVMGIMIIVITINEPGPSRILFGGGLSVLGVVMTAIAIVNLDH